MYEGCLNWSSGVAANDSGGHRHPAVGNSTEYTLLPHRRAQLLGPLVLRINSSNV